MRPQWNVNVTIILEEWVDIFPIQRLWRCVKVWGVLVLDSHAFFHTVTNYFSPLKNIKEARRENGSQTKNRSSLHCTFIKAQGSRDYEYSWISLYNATNKHKLQCVVHNFTPGKRNGGQTRGNSGPTVIYWVLLALASHSYLLEKRSPKGRTKLGLLCALNSAPAMIYHFVPL